MKDWKYSHMSIDVMHSDRFGNVKELRFETAKSTDMDCAILLEGRFDDARESSFQDSKFRIWAAKRSISTSQKSLFQAAKYSNMSKNFDLLMFSNRVFRIRYGEIWAALCCKMVVLLMLRNRVFRL